MNRLVCFVALLIAVNGKVLANQDRCDNGYDRLFRTSNDSVAFVCTQTQQKIPSGLTGGFFLLPSASQMEMGEQKFTTILDAYGKMTKVFFKDEENVCFETSMLATNFYNRSISLGHVAPGVFFTKTDPPRKCKIPGCNQVAMMTGKVDNTYVNTVHVNESYFLVTDSHVWIEFDPSTLSVHDAIHWDKKDNADLHITELGSAHPLRRPNHPRIRYLSVCWCLL